MDLQSHLIDSRSSNPAAIFPEPPALELQSLGISKSMPQSSLLGNSVRTPLKRPDSGGTLYKQCVQLLANHFHVTFNPQTINHYNIKIEREVEQEHDRNTEISKPLACNIIEKLFADRYTESPLFKTVYDGDSSIFSSIELDTGSFDVKVFRDESPEAYTTYKATIQLVKELELQKLGPYLKGNLQSIPCEILQGMDLVMKENPTRNSIRTVQSFFSSEFNSVELGPGIIASRGFQQSLKPTSKVPALCVDHLVLPFQKKLPVKDFIKENLAIELRKEERLHDWELLKIENALKGLLVTVNHRKTNRKYRIQGLTEKISNDMEFIDDNDDKNQRTMGIMDFFRDKYNKIIEYKYLPCLDLSENRKNYVPIEFCELVEQQRYSNGGDIAENFEKSVSIEMTEVTARVLAPPYLKLADANHNSIKFTLDKEEGHWNLNDKYVLEGKQIKRWGILEFVSHNRLVNDQFVKALKDRCAKLNINLDHPIISEASQMHVLSDSNALRELLKRIASEQLQILICVLAKKDPGYKNLKRISETEIGILTQCCVFSHVNKAKDHYFVSLALKINAKLGGSNMELFDRLPGLEGEDHVMFIGANVNHPSPMNTSCPSIAAVVATVNWPAANQYSGRISPQGHLTENIQNFGEMCLELLNTYVQLNKVQPKKIVVFRDGVSESQFEMVLNEELTDLKSKIEIHGYSPTITVVISQKRHSTRLFPKDMMEITGNEKILPGTVVDTAIVHPEYFDFYLCSQHGSLWRSKPTHYTVIYDENDFTSDKMQRIIYNLCFTFARCTKPVSLVPPVYYADLLSYRGRLYHDSSSSSQLFDGKLKLHRDLENVMFFC